MPARIIVFLLVQLITSINYGQTRQQFRLTKAERDAMFEKRSTDSTLAAWLGDSAASIKKYINYKKRIWKTDSIWNHAQKNLPHFEPLSNTSQFEMIPLIEALPGKTEFKPGYGVSYLIKTDSATILFDTGVDMDSVSAVFRYNLNKLGLSPGDIDIIFISHNHGDHQDQWKWVTNQAMVDKDGKSVLPGIRIYVPENTLDLPVKSNYSEQPAKIAKGVYSSGIIQAPVFFDLVKEQCLYINVKDLGIVCIMGCGHQGVDKVLDRYNAITNIPLYGILGGMHLAATGDNIPVFGYYIANHLPWEPFTLKDIEQRITSIKKYKPRLVGLSTHDSFVTTINAFKKAFPAEYKDLIPGEWIKPH